jgi:ureidoglycolate lyase
MVASAGCGCSGIGIPHEAVLLKPERLELEPLTAEAFAPFGEVIQRQGVSPESINYGRTQKYADLARIDTAEGGGETTVHLYRSQAVTLPFRIERMERHLLGSQAFMPLHQQPFPVIVAPPGDDPKVQAIRGFITNGEQGINLHKGVWHHYQISLSGICDYLVIDRAGPQNNCEEWVLERHRRIYAS